MDIPPKFVSKNIEKKWYSYWMENEFFSSTPDERDPYTLVIPPPNVTGVLHMGHMLNNTLQDIIIRRARMQGYNACWVPGTDHASIATEAKVVAKLKEQGIDKSDLSREEFLKHAWDWTREYGGVILEQLKKIGCSCDWNRTKFTLDEQMSASVIATFIKLFDQGLIYRGYRMVNWDPEAKTTLSDEEVIYEERDGQLYHIAYKVVDSDEKVIIATTRPETLFGDTAVCINPQDERYFHLKGKKLIGGFAVGPSICKDLGNDKKRTVLKLKKHLAPIKAAVIPLKRNNDDLVKLTHSIKSSLQQYQIGRVVVENTGNIGKSYRKHDEIGTPLCITVDFDTLENKTVTIRDRDTMEQKTISLDEVNKYFIDYFSDVKY